ncbi:unnamed protein product [Linum tenue]|uniref:Uncharacterized protein n=1 Tax=Linum tenue TaxID=586396 RepID=A0AAV0N4L1_9ROSI|nr:unnamed protein product [Linum tenue]
MVCSFLQVYVWLEVSIGDRFSNAVSSVSIVQGMESGEMKVLILVGENGSGQTTQDLPERWMAHKSDDKPDPVQLKAAHFR